MNKIFFIFFLIIFNANAQDSLAVAKTPKANSIQYTEKDIQTDSDKIEAKTFSKDFQKKYTDSDFVYEQKAPEKNLWDHFTDWLANILRKLFTFDNPKTAINVVGFVLKTLAFLAVIFVIYLIAKALINKEGKWIFGKDSNKKVIHYTDLEKNIHLLDFEKLIAESLQKGEKRLCIRYYYLWLLKVMAQNHYIEWDIEKTNSDYLYEIFNPAHKERFSYLSYLYNYIWYGEFEIDELTFEKAENSFKNAIKTFSNE